MFRKAGQQLQGKKKGVIRKHLRAALGRMN